MFFIYSKNALFKVSLMFPIVLLLFLLLLPALVLSASMGDVDSNGTVDVKDVVMVMRHVLEIEFLDSHQKILADVNHDGKIDVSDVVLIMRKSLGLIEAFPEVPNSRANPAKIGDVITVQGDDFRYGSHSYEVELVEVVIGEQAWTMIESANPFNSPPDEGMVYVLAKFRFKIIEVEEEPFAVNHAKFDVVRKDGTVYSDYPFIVMPTPDLRTDLYVGAEHDGWTCFMVTENDEPLAVWDRTWDSEVWFELVSGTKARQSASSD